MTEITFHRGRMPGEPDIFEVKTSSNTCWSGIFYFEKVSCKTCELIQVDMKKHYKKEDYIIEAAKSLIRERDQQVVYDEKSEVIAELSIGSRYKEPE